MQSVTTDNIRTKGDEFPLGKSKCKILQFTIKSLNEVYNGPKQDNNNYRKIALENTSTKTSDYCYLKRYETYFVDYAVAFTNEISKFN